MVKFVEFVFHQSVSSFDVSLFLFRLLFFEFQRNRTDPLRRLIPTKTLVFFRLVSSFQSFLHFIYFGDYFLVYVFHVQLQRTVKETLDLDQEAEGSVKLLPVLVIVVNLGVFRSYVVVVGREDVNDIIVLIAAMNLIARFVFQLAIHVICSPMATE